MKHPGDGQGCKDGDPVLLRLCLLAVKTEASGGRWSWDSNPASKT